MPNRSEQTLFIGIDGAEPMLVQQWSEDGTLPVLRGLMESGTCRSVETLPGMGDGATWPTLITGVNPARHGRYFRRQLKPGTYDIGLYEVERDNPYPPFWDAISESGQRTMVLDLPYSPITSKANQVVMTDWLVHDRYGSPRSFPVDFAGNVIERFGDDPFHGMAELAGNTPEQLKTVLKLSRERVRSKAALVLDSMSHRQWNFLATCFTETHDVGHMMWHLHDVGHPKHDSQWTAEIGDPLRILYRDIDDAIGNIVSSAPAGTQVAIFIGLGMGPDYTANNILERIVRRLNGQSDRQPTMRRRLRSLGAPRALVKASGRVERALSGRARARSRFFALPHNENSGAIRINLLGREPNGTVSDEGYDAVCEEVADAFGELVNSRTGTRVVHRVIKVADHYAGGRSDWLPDLLVEWARGEPFESVYSPRVGHIDNATSWGRTGDHSANAMFIMSPAVTAGGCLPSPFPLVDIAPTLAATRGVCLRSVDGIARHA